MGATGDERRRPLQVAGVLLLASHPGPALAVTVLTGALLVAVGNGAATTALGVAAVLAGQLSIGWCNDVVDAARDRSAGRTGKPVATGAVEARTVGAAAFAALALSVPLSLAVGPRPGLAHLGVVAGGWAYDLGLKRTPLSWVPYAVSFGLLPVFATLALPEPRLPPVWLVAAASVLACAAHLFNGLPDIDEDRAAGLRPLPVVLGGAGTRWCGAALLAATGLLLALGPGGLAAARPWVLATAALTAGLAVLSAVIGTRHPAAATSARRTWLAEVPFALVVTAAALDVALLLITGAART